MPVPTLAESRWLRFITLCSLYFAQGVPWGFVSIALIAVLNERGATPQQTGALISLSLLPWTFKIIWGPTIDSFRLPSLGMRRPWIILAQLGMASTLLIAFSAADVTADSTLTLLGAIFFTHNCFASLQDVATDGMAVDLLDEDERGRVNGFMWASKLFGISVGGAGMASLIAVLSLEAGMKIMAGMILAIMLLPLLLRERPGDKRFPWSRGPHVDLERVHGKTGPFRVIKELIRAHMMRATSLGLILALVAFICEGLSIPITAALFTQDLGWTAEQYGHAQGIFGTAGKLLGALGGGYLCDKLGIRRIAFVGMTITLLTFVVFGLTAEWWETDGYPLVAYILCLETGVAMTSVSLFSLFMKISWTTAAATQFTLYMTMLNVGNAFGPVLTRLNLDYPKTYLLCGALAALPLLVLPFLKPSTVVVRKQGTGKIPPDSALDSPAL